MSKLDNIILDCANKVLDGNEETLGDYIDPTKEAIKALMLELVGENEEPAYFYGDAKWGDSNADHCSVVYGRNEVMAELRKKIGEL